MLKKLIELDASHYIRVRAFSQAHRTFTKIVTNYSSIKYFFFDNLLINKILTLREKSKPHSCKVRICFSQKN